MPTLLLALGLAACAAPERNDADLKRFARRQIHAWEALGLDPARADPRTLTAIAAACAAAAAAWMRERGLCARVLELRRSTEGG